MASELPSSPRAAASLEASRIMTLSRMADAHAAVPLLRMAVAGAPITASGGLKAAAVSAGAYLRGESGMVSFNHTQDRSHAMTAFPEWLRQVGLAHCRPILQAHGIDFDEPLTSARRTCAASDGNPDDTQTLLRAIASRGQPAVGGSGASSYDHVLRSVDLPGLSERDSIPRKVRV